MKSPEWIRESLKLYFLNRPGVSVDAVDLVGYFHVASVLDAAQDLVDAGWLIRTGGVYPRFLRHCPGVDALGLMPRLTTRWQGANAPSENLGGGIGSLLQRY